MKLAITYGSFSPPTITDRALFDHLAGYAGVNTKCILLTDDRFDRNHPLGILEKQEVLSLMISRNVELRMDHEHLLKFLEVHSEDYESITVVQSTEFPASAQKAIRAYSKVPVEFDLVNVGNEQDARDDLLAALYGHDFDLFRKYYGGTDITVIEIYNKLKDRVICQS